MKDDQSKNSISVPHQLGTILFIILIIGLVVAVSRNARSTQPIINEDFIEIENSIQTPNTSNTFSEENEFYSLKADFPSEKLDKNNVMVNSILAEISARQEAWKIGGDLHQAELDISQEFPDRPIMKYEFLSSYTKKESPIMGTVSYLVTNYEFTGGAHGMPYINTYTFSSQGRVSIDAILNLNNQNQIILSNLIAQKLELLLGDMADKEMIQMGLGLRYLNEQGQFDASLCECGDFTLHTNFDNFIVSDEGITFIFNPYQVAAYAVGMPEVLLTWQELAPFIKLVN